MSDVITLDEFFKKIMNWEEHYPKALPQQVQLVSYQAIVIRDFPEPKRKSLWLLGHPFHETVSLD